MIGKITHGYASAIEHMIDSAIRCVICGKPPGCECWISLECPACGAKRTVERHNTDPPGTARILSLCHNETVPGKIFAYFDKDGREIPTEWT